MLSFKWRSPWNVFRKCWSMLRHGNIFRRSPKQTAWVDDSATGQLPRTIHQCLLPYFDVKIPRNDTKTVLTASTYLTIIAALTFGSNLGTKIREIWWNLPGKVHTWEVQCIPPFWVSITQSPLRLSKIGLTLFFFFSNMLHILIYTTML